MRRTARDGANAVGYRRSLFLTTAIIALVTAVAGLRPASAQSVTGTGLAYPGGGPTTPWSVGGDLQINSPSPGVSGTLDILNGGKVTNDTAFIGLGTADQGTVTVSGTDAVLGASTWTNNNDLVVGQGGTGTLVIQNGGVVKNMGAWVGADGGSQGDVTVTGLGSTWTSTGQTIIGDHGTGTLTILNGGVVNSTSTASLGQQGGTGTVTVSGQSGGNASTWNITDQINIGGTSFSNGVGTLNILHGGVVNSSQGNIAWGPGSQGDVLVSGRDISNNASTWNAADNIYVGAAGNGSLTILDGATVATTGTGPGGMAAIYIGYLPGSTGTVDISSSTGNVSRLTATDYVDVGTEGAGTLTIGKDGFVSAGSNVYIARFGTASGTLHLNGDATGRGVLETGSVTKGPGLVTVLDLNGGILRANRDEADFLRNFATLTVGSEGAWFDTNSHDIGINTDFSGSSRFNKLGLGQLTLTGDSPGFTGASTVSAGTLAVNGTLGGDMLVDTAGRLVGTGRVGNVVNAGVVAPGYGNAMGILTVQGNYAGNGGRLEIATVLGGDTSPTSRLMVTGGTSGVTQVGIINRGGPGAQTMEGIKIVDVAGASNGSFVLDGNYVFQGAPAVIAGAYAYRLYKGGVSTPSDGDWYLRSALSASDTPGGSPNQPYVPLYQPGVPIYEAYGSNLQAFNTLSTLEQRVGNRIWGPGANGDGNGIWGRTEGSRARFDDIGASTTGLNQTIETWKMQAGADRVLFDDGTLGRLVAGVNVSYGEVNSRISSVFGNGGLKTNGYGLGATLTWYGATGFYVDGQAQLARYSSDLNSDLLGPLAHNNDGSGKAFSIEVGKRISFGESFGVTPQFQVAYSNVRFDRFIDPSGADVAADRYDSLKTRWGIALDLQSAWDGGRGRIYGIANVSHEWLDGLRTLVAGTSVINTEDGMWGELGLGASVNWRKDLTVYGEVSANTPFRDFGDSYILRANLGLRAQF